MVIPTQRRNPWSAEDGISVMNFVSLRKETIRMIIPETIARIGT